MPEKVSAIIPTYNEEANIEACLLSLKNQTIPPDEIIIVDDNSTDNTVTIARKYASIVYIKNPGEPRGIGISRAIGTSIAKNNIILSTDGDTILDSHFIEIGLKLLEPENVIAVTGPPHDINHSWFWELWASLAPHKGRGYNTMFKKNMCNIERCYVNTTRSGHGEDWILWDDLSRQGETVYSPELIAYTDLPTTKNFRTFLFLVSIITIFIIAVIAYKLHKPK